MTQRLLVLCALLAMTMVGCGEDAPTVSEYAAEVEQLVAGMVVQFEMLDEDWEAQTPSVEGAQDYWAGRLEVRHDFLDSIRAIEPPQEIAAMHQSAVDVFTRITEADVALEARVAAFESFSEHWEWVDTAEGKAADAVLEEVFAFCRASQDEFDTTKDRDAFGDTAWLPAETREVVRVAFGCPPRSD